MYMYMYMWVGNVVSKLIWACIHVHVHSGHTYTVSNRQCLKHEKHCKWPRCSNYTMQAADLVVLTLTCYTFECMHVHCIHMK